MVEYKTETGMSRRGFLKATGVGALAMTMPMSLLETAVNAAEAKTKAILKSSDAEKFSQATQLDCRCYGIVQQQKVGGWFYSEPTNHNRHSANVTSTEFGKAFGKKGLTGVFADASQYDMVPIDVKNGVPSMYLIVKDGANVYEKTGEPGNVDKNQLKLERMIGEEDFTVQNTIDEKLELLISTDNDYKPKKGFEPVTASGTRCQSLVDLNTHNIFKNIGHNGNVIHLLTTVNKKGENDVVGAVVYDARQKVEGTVNPDFEGEFPETFKLNATDLGNYFTGVKSATPIVEGVQMNAKSDYLKLTIGAPKIYDTSRDTGKGKGGTGGAGGNGGRGGDAGGDGGQAMNQVPMASESERMFVENSTTSKTIMRG